MQTKANTTKNIPKKGEDKKEALSFPQEDETPGCFCVTFFLSNNLLQINCFYPKWICELKKIDCQFIDCRKIC